MIAIVLTAAAGFFTMVPFVPTPKPVAEAMVRLARMKGTEHVYDPGAGDGAVLIAAKRLHPSIRATGIEFSPVIWLMGRMKTWWNGGGIAFLLRNIHRVPLRDADVIFLYLTPGMMRMLQDKFNRELRPGTVVVSHAFSFPEKQPVEIVKVPFRRRQVTLHRYVW